MHFSLAGSPSGTASELQRDVVRCSSRNTHLSFRAPSWRLFKLFNAPFFGFCMCLQSFYFLDPFLLLHDGKLAAGNYMWVASLNRFFLLVLLLQLSDPRGTGVSSRLSTIDTFPSPHPSGWAYQSKMLNRLSKP